MDAMNLAASVAGGAAKRTLLPWAILAAVVLWGASAGFAYYEGWARRGDHEAAQQLKTEREWQAKVEAERKRGDALALDLEAEKRNIKTVTVEVIKEVPKVTTVYVEKPGEAPKPIPPAVYTWGFVGLWNDALAARLPGAAGEPAGAAGAADLARAPIDSPDLLENHAVNAGKYAECRAQLNALIDWHEGK